MATATEKKWFRIQGVSNASGAIYSVYPDMFQGDRWEEAAVAFAEGRGFDRRNVFFWSFGQFDLAGQRFRVVA